MCRERGPAVLSAVERAGRGEPDRSRCNGDRKNQRGAGSRRSWRTRSAKARRLLRRQTRSARQSGRGGSARPGRDAPARGRAGRAACRGPRRPRGVGAAGSSCGRGSTSCRRRCHAALQQLFEGLDAPRTAAVMIGRQVARGAFAFVNQHLVLQCSGISPSRKPGASSPRMSPVPRSRGDGSAASRGSGGAGKGIIVETADGSRRFRATLRELSALLLEEHREELVTALLEKTC